MAVAFPGPGGDRPAERQGATFTRHVPRGTAVIHTGGGRGGDGGGRGGDGPPPT
jgi:hypothetical protein